LAEPTQDLGPFKGGQPFKFTDPDELRRLIQNYFDWCGSASRGRLVEAGVNQQGRTIFTKRMIMTTQPPYTLSGLARAHDHLTGDLTGEPAGVDARHGGHLPTVDAPRGCQPAIRTFRQRQAGSRNVKLSFGGSLHNQTELQEDA
jgi:hypothetical protein